MEGRRIRIAAVAYTHYASDPRVRRETGILADAGYQVDVYSLEGRAADRSLSENGVRLLDIPLPRYRGSKTSGYLSSYAAFLLKASYCLMRQHRRQPYDLVHIHTMPDLMVLAALFLKLSGVPVILDVHDQMPEIYKGKFGLNGTDWRISLLLLSERVSARLADRVLTPTENQAHRLEGNRIPGEKLVVVHNLPDPRIFGRPGSLIDDPDPDLFRISYHGTLAHRLGLGLALEGLASAREEMDRRGPWRLDILGDGDAREELRELTRSHRLEDRVSFSEGFVPVDELVPSLRGVNLGIVPNLAQPDTDLMLPTKLLEYLYLGIPALTTPTATVRSYLNGDQVTFISEPDPQAWIQAILRLRDDPEKRRAQAECALEFFKRHSWERESEKLLGVVDELVSRPR